MGRLIDVDTAVIAIMKEACRHQDSYYKGICLQIAIMLNDDRLIPTAEVGEKKDDC